MIWPNRCSNSSKLKRPVVEADGRRKPYSTRVCLRWRRRGTCRAPGDALVALVDDDQRILGEVVEQLGGGSPGARRKDAGSNSRFRAMPTSRSISRSNIRALVDPLCLEQLPLPLQLRLALDQLGLDRLEGVREPRPGRHIVAGRIYGDLGQPAQALAGQGIEGRDRLHLVAEQLDADPVSS